MPSRAALARPLGLALVLTLIAGLTLWDRTRGDNEPGAPTAGTPTSSPTFVPEPTQQPTEPPAKTTKPAKPEKQKIPTPPPGIEKLTCKDERTTKDIRVMSFNTHRSFGGIETIVQEMREWDPDIVLLQEIDRFWGRTGWLDQAAFFGERLDMEWAFRAAVKQGRSEYGIAILSRFPILQRFDHPLPWAPGAERRGLLGIGIEVKGTPLRVYDLHLQHQMTGLRIAQAQAVAGVLDTVEEPVILGGDMNATSVTTAMAPILARLQDTFGMVGTGRPGTGPHDSRIDFVLAATPLVPLRSVAMRSKISDHARVISDIEVPTKTWCADPRPSKKRG